MTAEKIKSRINEICSHFTFEYHGKRCGIDPISHSHFDVWCGEESMLATNIEDVMTTPFFDGKSLNEIYNEIEIDAW